MAIEIVDLPSCKRVDLSSSLCKRLPFRVLSADDTSMTFLGTRPLRIALFIGLLEILGVFATWEGLLRNQGMYRKLYSTPEGNIGKCTVSLCYSRINRILLLQLRCWRQSVEIACTNPQEFVCSFSVLGSSLCQILHFFLLSSKPCQRLKD